MNDKLLFQETQYSPGSLILALVVTALFSTAVIYLLRIKNTSFRIAALFTGLVGLFILSIACTLRLKTFYYTDGVSYQFVSVFSAPYEQVAMDTVIKAEVVTYNPADYGGWGMKHSVNDTALAYSTSGNKGLLLRFKNGKKLLLGTQKPDNLAFAIKQYYPH